MVDPQMTHPVLQDITARIVERMQRDGLISAPDRTGKREIL